MVVGRLFTRAMLDLMIKHTVYAAQRSSQDRGSTVETDVQKEENGFAVPHQVVWFVVLIPGVMGVRFGLQDGQRSIRIIGALDFDL